jgi:pimeloyl-ACP methyl ester carboxylesterase
MVSVNQKANDLLANGVIESQKLKVGNRQAHYLRGGNGPPIILLHGGADDSNTWAETIAALSDSYSFYAPDLVGYGLSDKDKGSYYLSEFVDFTFGFIQTLGLDSMSLVGHSLGGRVCLEIALRHPQKVRRLVLIDTVGLGKLAWWGTFLGGAAWAIRKVLRRPQPYPRFLKEKGEDKDWRCLEKLDELKMPTMLVWNRLDPYYSVRHAINAKKLMPEARLEVFPGYGHAPHVRNRECFNNLLLEFLNHNQA